MPAKDWLLPDCCWACPLPCLVHTGTCSGPLLALLCLPCCCVCACTDFSGRCRTLPPKPFRIQVLKKDPDYDTVLAAFESNFARKKERGAQLVVYDQADLKLDLAGVTLPEPKDKKYGPDSLNLLYSSTKVFSSLAMAILFDRGHLDYNDKVATYWPNFAKKGKGDITIAQILRHEAKLFSFSEQLTFDMTLEQIGKAIEESEPAFHWKSRDGNYRAYHAMSRGFLLNQIARRADPQERTIGRIVREEILVPLGLATDVVLGECEEEQSKRAYPITGQHLLNTVGSTIFPSLLNCNLPWTDLSHSSRSMLRPIFGSRHGFHDNALFSRTLFGQRDPQEHQDIISDPSNQFEAGSFLGMANARALAKIAAMMSNGGEIGGVRVLKKSTVQKAQSEPKPAWDHLLNNWTCFTLGGLGVFCPEIVDTKDKKGKARKSIPKLQLPLKKALFGWCGMNGSLFLWESPGKAVGYNCSGHAGAFPFDIRSNEILRQLGLDWALERHGPVKYALPPPPARDPPRCQSPSPSPSLLSPRPEACERARLTDHCVLEKIGSISLPDPVARPLATLTPMSLHSAFGTHSSTPMSLASGTSPMWRVGRRPSPSGGSASGSETGSSWPSACEDHERPDEGDSLLTTTRAQTLKIDKHPPPDTTEHNPLLSSDIL